MGVQKGKEKQHPVKSHPCEAWKVYGWGGGLTYPYQHERKKELIVNCDQVKMLVAP